MSLNVQIYKFMRRTFARVWRKMRETNQDPNKQRKKATGKKSACRGFGGQSHEAEDSPEKRKDAESRSHSWILK